VLCPGDGNLQKLIPEPVDVTMPLTGIELMHTVRKGQLQMAGQLHPASSLYPLAT